MSTLDILTIVLVLLQAILGALLARERKKRAEAEAKSTDIETYLKAAVDIGKVIASKLKDLGFKNVGKAIEEFVWYLEKGYLSADEILEDILKTIKE